MLIAELRAHYLDVFRDTLAAAAEFRPDKFDDLTLANLETLIATLNDPDPQRVKVALEVFAEQDRAHLIPGLILYHPSPDVLAQALDLLATSGRTDFIPLADRLLDHEYADVRAAALRARMAVAPDEALLRERVELSCPVVRATALVGLTSGGYASIDETGPYFDEVIRDGSEVAREALARAIGYAPGEDFEDVLIRLAAGRESTVLLSVVRSMKLAPTERFIPSLIAMLPQRALRSEIRRTLGALGQPAFDALSTALRDDRTPVETRQQIPRALLKFSALVRRVAASPARDVRTLLQWQVFNVLAGNDDGHAKNLTLSLEGRPALAPFYDLVCTAAIDRVSRSLAIPIGGSRDSGNLSAQHWAAEEQALGLRRGAFTRIVTEMAGRLPHALDAACEALAEQLPSSPVLERVPAAISRRVRRAGAALQT